MFQELLGEETGGKSRVGRKMVLSSLLSFLAEARCLRPSLLASPRKCTQALSSLSLGHLHWHGHRLQLFQVLLHLGWKSGADLILFLKDILSFFSERWQQSRHDWRAHVNGCFNCWAFRHHSPTRIKVAFSSYHLIFQKYS